jgi:flagellar motor component MotA
MAGSPKLAISPPLMLDPTDRVHELAQHCELCREAVRERLAAFDRRLLALEIVVRGEDGHNGMKSQLSKLCDRFDQFEKKAIRVIAIGTSLPGVVVAVLGVLKFLGKL